jgi:hypothetical protein
MSNEEGHKLTDQIATKNANIQEVYGTANSRNRNQSNQTSRVFLRLFVAISSFFLRHSLCDIHLFVFRWSLDSCHKNKLSRICSVVPIVRTGYFFSLSWLHVLFVRPDAQNSLGLSGGFRRRARRQSIASRIRGIGPNATMMKKNVM